MSRAEDRLDHVRSTLRPHLAELSKRRPALYWADLLTTSAVAWSALAGGAAIVGGVLPGGLSLAALLFVVAVLAVYRAIAFMHEVTHVRGAMPAYALAWDVLVGVPLLLPSLLYVGVHTTHHDHKVFGTERDPEYVGHEGRGRHHYLSVALHFALVPAFLVLRWLVLAPVSFLHAGVRRFVVERLSSFADNAAYRRPIPVGDAARRWHALEASCFVWTALVVGLAVCGVVPLASLGFVLAVATCVSVLHGARSLTTHRFGGAGELRTTEEQFLDSTNVTGHPIWTELWAPAGLRYHALHHFAPRLPYHSLGKAHRLLLASLPEDDVYRSVTFRGLVDVAAHVTAPAATRRPRVATPRASVTTAEL